jgi:hypothetical protein
MKDISEFVPSIGSIILGDGHDFTAGLQHFVNGKCKDGHGRTHGCNTTYPGGSTNQFAMVLSAEINGDVHELWTKFCNDDSKYNIWVYEIVGMTKEEIEYGLDYLEKTFLNVSYAFWAWPWFGWKALVNRVINPLADWTGIKWLHHDINTENNWFTKNVFCTKQEWIYLDKSSEIHPSNWTELRNILHEYSPDTFDPVDLGNITLTYPKFFKLTAQRIDGITTLFE